MSVNTESHSVAETSGSMNHAFDVRVDELRRQLRFCISGWTRRPSDVVVSWEFLADMLGSLGWGLGPRFDIRVVLLAIRVMHRWPLSEMHER